MVPKLAWIEQLEYHNKLLMNLLESTSKLLNRPLRQPHYLIMQTGNQKHVCFNNLPVNEADKNAYP